MNKKIISIILIIILCLNIFAIYSFADSTNKDTAINTLVKMKIIIGDDDGNLMLDKNFTRAEFATVIVRLLDIEKTETPKTDIKFSDVPTTFWGYSNIYRCVSKGYLIGDGNGTFRPNDPIKYEEVLTILLRLLNKEEANMNWPDDYITKSQSVGITKNTNLGKGTINRADSFVLVYNSLSIKF